MFRDEKLILPTIKDLAPTLFVALGAFVANNYSPLLGYLLALLTIILIASQFLFSIRIWPTVAHNVNPWFFMFYWGLIMGLVIPFLVLLVATEGINSLWTLMIS